MDDARGASSEPAITATRLSEKRKVARPLHRKCVQLQLGCESHSTAIYDLPGRAATQASFLARSRIDLLRRESRVLLGSHHLASAPLKHARTRAGVVVTRTADAGTRVGHAPHLLAHPSRGTRRRRFSLSPLGRVLLRRTAPSRLAVLSSRVCCTGGPHTGRRRRRRVGKETRTRSLRRLGGRCPRKGRRGAGTPERRRWSDRRSRRERAKNQARLSVRGTPPSACPATASGVSAAAFLLRFSS